MKTCIKCLKEIDENMMFCPYCGEKQDSDDFLSNLDNSLSEQIETKITLEKEQEKFNIFEYEKITNSTYVIKGLKNKYVYKVDIPEGVVTICEEAFANSRIIEVNLPDSLMEIEARAFKDCSYLKKINNMKNVNIIGDEAFCNCTLLKVECNKEDIKLGIDVFVGTINEKIEEEELKRKEIEEEEKKAKEEAERKAVEEAKKKALAEKRAREQAAKESAEKRDREQATKEEAERKAKEEFEKEKLRQEEIELNKIKLKKLQNELNMNDFFKIGTFGRYPQDLVTEEDLIIKLNEIKSVNKCGYIEYEGKEYYKRKLENLENYCAYFLVKPLRWIIIRHSNNDITMITKDVIDVRSYTTREDKFLMLDKIYDNNYEHSDIRAWLNGYDNTANEGENYKGNGFIDIAFNEKEKEIIMESKIDNSKRSGAFKKYVCNNTIDKVYLLSLKEVNRFHELVRVSKGSNLNMTRFLYNDGLVIHCKYFRGNGIWGRECGTFQKNKVNEFFLSSDCLKNCKKIMDEYNETHFLLRTPSINPSYKEKYKKDGKFVLHYFSDEAISVESNYSFGIRPVIQININKPNE